MGHDVHIIGNHNLDLSSMEALAKDISKRFKANVEYGYFSFCDFDIDGNSCSNSTENMHLGFIEHPIAATTLCLNDEYYMYHAVLDKYGKDAYNLPYFTQDDGYFRRELDEALGNIRYELWDNAIDDNYAVIYNDTIHDSYNYFSPRWWSFCDTLCKADKDFIDYLITPFRKEVLQFFEKVGGTEVFYFDDQGESQYLSENYYDWNTILMEVEMKFKETTLHIHKLMKDNQPNPWLIKPLAFYDNFSDLKK